MVSFNSLFLKKARLRAPEVRHVNSKKNLQGSNSRTKELLGGSIISPKRGSWFGHEANQWFVLNAKRKRWVIGQTWYACEHNKHIGLACNYVCVCTIYKSSINQLKYPRGGAPSCEDDINYTSRGFSPAAITSLLRTVWVCLRNCM